MSDLHAAVAAGVLGAESSYRSLLQSTVEVARAIFHAKAASVFLLDVQADELVFEAVAGEGAGALVVRAVDPVGRLAGVRIHRLGGGTAAAALTKDAALP